MNVKCTLVIPTYNWPEALELILLSIKKQSVLPNEVIIANDGSSEKTLQLITEFQKDFPVDLIHVYQKDLGNRKSAILNKAIAKSHFEYIIEIDGDIILHKDFIKDHLYHAQKGFYLFGSRVQIKKSLVDYVFKNKKINYTLFTKGIDRRGRTIHLPTQLQNAKEYSAISNKLRGCNMSFWREDFIKINGFNESFTGWGYEDSEMIQRLHNIDLKGKRLKHSGIAYHIYHKEQNKSQIANNKALEEKARQNKITFIEKGINQYL